MRAKLAMLSRTAVALTLTAFTASPTLAQGLITKKRLSATLAMEALGLCIA